MRAKIKNQINDIEKYRIFYIFIEFNIIIYNLQRLLNVKFCDKTYNILIYNSFVKKPSLLLSEDCFIFTFFLKIYFTINLYIYLYFYSNL